MREIITLQSNNRQVINSHLTKTLPDNTLICFCVSSFLSVLHAGQSDAMDF